MEVLKSLGNRSTCEDVRNIVSKVPGNKINSLRNGTIIITGANTGIGKKTAQHLTYLGSMVIFACRNITKANEAIKDIRLSKECEKFGLQQSALRMESMELDLSSLESVKTFVDTFKAQSISNKWPPLKCLVLNAGLFSVGDYGATKDGFEKTFGTNHLGHFYLSELLRPILNQNSSKTDASRVVVVASESHLGPLVSKNVESTEVWRNDIAFCKPDSWNMSKGIKCYGSSKLANVLFAKKFNALNAPSVRAASLHPGGMIATDVMRDNIILNWITHHVLSWFTKSLDQGSATTLFVVLAPDNLIKGQYFSDCHEKLMSRRATDTAANILWDLSVALLQSRSFL